MLDFIMSDFSDLKIKILYNIHTKRAVQVMLIILTALTAIP